MRISLESSERIRKQQKELIALLQRSHAMSSSASHAADNSSVMSAAGDSYMSSIAPSDEMHTSGRIFDQSHSFRDRCVSLLVVLYSHFNVCYVTGLTLWDQPPQTRSPRFSRGILITPQILPRVVPTSLQPPTANSSPKCGAGSLTGRRWYNLPPRQPALKVPIRLHSVMCTDLQALRCPLRPPPGPSRAASHDPHLRPRPRPILSLPLPPTFNTTVMHTSRTITCHKSSYITSTSSKRCSTSL